MSARSWVHSVTATVRAPHRKPMPIAHGAGCRIANHRTGHLAVPCSRAHRVIGVGAK